MNNLVILHFQPLENYPPITNIIINLSDTEPPERRITILTNSPRNQNRGLFRTSDDRINVIRIAYVDKGYPLWKRCFYYLKFNTVALFILLKLRPSVVSYFETLSSLPAILYYSQFNRKAKIAVHYHEYTSPIDYKNGMWLNNLYHRLEKKYFNNFFWISHTNKIRLQLFLNDNNNIDERKAHTMPNYPPKTWKGTHKISNRSEPVRVIYIGALSCEDTYLKEFCSWVMEHAGAIIFDIFSNNFKPDAIQYVKSLNSRFIKFYGGTDYHSIPELLTNYSIGVILYRGTSENYIYNAPNKLFEYLSGDLDVWYPTVMVGTNEYQTKDTYPKVTPIDFTTLHNIDLNSLISKKGLRYKPSEYWCECAIEKFKTSILKG